ncbi:hypothetical protein [uncultured Agrobacterium sp.]|uniref:hypothetical protein n=1 Tax=uncultured Agrobacterium sp. TaxID=157277 RepID=UPI0025D52E15|nr:hypothetical protein [uncultured Agrobacterium sp.]
MTAINTFVRESGVYFVVDGATYLPSFGGNPARTGRMAKVHHIPWLGAAFAITGPVMATFCLGPLIGDSLAGDFDEFTAEFPDLLRRGAGDMSRAGQGHLFSPCEVVIGGWSNARERYEAYAVSTDGGVSNGKPAFTLRPVTKYIRPYPPAAVGAVFEAEHAARDGMRILEMQRQANVESIDGKRVNGAIGAFAQLAHLTREGMTSKLIGVFEDAA